MQVPALRHYGTVRHDSRYWLIECDIQVRARLKRVFPKINEFARELKLLASVENSRELEWFLERYPMRMSMEDRLLLADRAEAHRQNEQAMALVLTGEHKTVQGELAKPARDYQLLPTEILMVSGGLLLADQVGLGKTVEAMVAMVQPGTLPCVVVYPAALPNHWPQKLAEFLPQYKVHVVSTSKPYPLIRQPNQRRKDLWDTLPDVILISYHKLRGWHDELAAIAKLVVFDEAQQLRNDDSDIYQASAKLAAACLWRLLLSATPIYNYGGEFFNVLQVAMPDALGSRSEFLIEWCASGGPKPRLKDPVAFGEYLRSNGLMLDRKRADVGRELPPVTRVIHEFDVDDKALASHATGAELLARTILGNQPLGRLERMQAHGEFERIMRQATGVAKAPMVAEFVRMLVDQGEQVVLFGWHRLVYEIWLEKLADLNPVLYTGSESPTQKAASAEAFVSGRSKVIIISLRSGAGLDGLQYVSSTAVYGELDWSPGVMEQTLGRVDRDGQQVGVMAYYLTATSGADPIMTHVLGLKQWQLDGVLQQDKSLVERTDIGENHLRAMASAYCAQHGITLEQEVA